VRVLLQVCVLELILSAYFFQKRSEHPLAIVHYIAQIHERLTATSNLEAIGIYREDLEFGYRHLPNSRGNHRSRSFSVTYTIGGEGERAIPSPVDPLGRILFLGSSYTFGFGVDDRENYPYLLATEHWQGWQVLNKAVNGWGTVHAHMLLEEELKGPSPPALAIYNSVPDHVCRNYLRPAWLKMLALSHQAHPHFELSAGRPIFRGLATVKDAVQDEAEVRLKELDLTAAFISSMHRQAMKRNVGFIVVLLPQRFEVACGPVAWPPSLIRALTEQGVSILDLSEIKGQMTWLEHDAHPDRGGHRVLASAMAESFVSDTLRSLAPAPAEAKN